MKSAFNNLQKFHITVNNNPAAMINDYNNCIFHVYGKNKQNFVFSNLILVY